MIGFEIKELRDIMKEKMMKDLFQEINKRKLKLIDCLGKKELMEEIANTVVAKNKNNKEYIEFFIALEIGSMFYQTDSKIFFVLKNSLQPEKTTIKNFEDLKNSIKEDSLTDFSIANSDGLRQFQLKQYKGELKTEDILEFINKKMIEYGNDIGDVNLIILLQGTGQYIPQFIDYEKLHNFFKNKLNSRGNILITYNDQNKRHIINEVFPNLSSTNRDIDMESLNGWLIPTT